MTGIACVWETLSDGNEEMVEHGQYAMTDRTQYTNDMAWRRPGQVRGPIFCVYSVSNPNRFFAASPIRNEMAATDSEIAAISVNRFRKGSSFATDK